MQMIFLQENWGIVSKQEKLVKLLAWANEKASLVETDKKVAGIRVFYIFLARVLDLARNLDIPYELKVDYLLLVSLLISNIVLWGKDNNKNHITDKIPSFLDFLNETLKIYMDNEFLHEHFKKINLPDKNSCVENWKIFTQQLRQTMQQERNNIRHEWDFSEEETNCLMSYSRANKLLLDCLKFASVSDRQGIEDKLLLPLE